MWKQYRHISKQTCERRIMHPANTKLPLTDTIESNLHFMPCTCSFVSIAIFLKKVLAQSETFAYSIFLQADMAQLVEHNLAKVGVAGSSPVFRSMLSQEPAFQSALLLRWRRGQVVRQGPAKPSPPVRIRSSPPAHEKGRVTPALAFFGGPTRIRTWNLSIMSRSR